MYCRLGDGALGPCWSHFGSLLAALGAVLGASLGELRSLYSRLGRCEDEETEHCENVRYPNGIGRFGLRAALLEALLGRLGSLLACLGASRAVLGHPGVI
eukprot:5932508-Pyramimonas_sp.AAC.1